MINLDELKNIDKKLIERYSTRYQKFGQDPKTLGWDNRTNQEIRFKNASRNIVIDDKKILDIGCGFADFYQFLLDSSGKTNFEYSGVDINPDLIGECSKRFPKSKFEIVNILTDPERIGKESYDIVSMFGVLNFKFSEIQNMDFAKSMINQAFEYTKEVLVVDMLSKVIDSKYKPDDFVYYYEPAEMLQFAMTLTPHVALIQDYASIPQREFVLQLRKNPV
ncbi:class I SAM-dependent methyltransferase [Leptospira yasudae]|uniref:Methyltransferase n=1 Tax=Leptospira yasudae TaxID=2202201 RepID=A0ABX9M051_9LEPT|nr:class I SAM-dependent methyltransferase [Leptospira yasudae]RHX78267.1 methyltransferase [Leptospira yasudae]TGK24520.1 class I SAM-dependent methyltransferase [Leptospira yasudae]TGM05694.1 class I SAM-dependent methyltransferase [Leptospira yasudae]